MGDFLLDHAGKIVVLLLLGCGIVFYYSIKANEAERQAFMAECIQHEPEYKCTSQWRAGDKNYTSSTVVPIFIPSR